MDGYVHHIAKQYIKQSEFDDAFRKIALFELYYFPS